MIHPIHGEVSFRRFPFLCVTGMLYLEMTKSHLLAIVSYENGCIETKKSVSYGKDTPFLLFLNFRMRFKNGLKAQKLLAQGIALGIVAVSKAPCKVGCSKSV